MKKSALNQTQRFSPLQQIQLLKNGGESASSENKKDLAPILSLTSLIDAFSIIVIYLLIGTQSGGMDTDVPSQMNLPSAESGALLDEETAIVRIQAGKYFIDDQQVDASQLGLKLYELKKQSGKTEFPILVQGDREMDYAELDPILKAGSEAGIQKLKFAVVPQQ